MYSENDLQSAIAAGVLSEETADALRAHVQASRQLSSLADEEQFRLVSGFNDIFVVIAAGLLLGALAVLANGFVVAAAAWGLAEFFTRKRRMALPSIVFLLVFVSAIFWAVWDWAPNYSLLAGLLAGAGAWLHWQRFRVPITVAAGTAAVLGSIFMLIFGSLPAEARDSGALIVLFIGGLTVFYFAMRWDRQDVARQTRRSDVAFWLHLLAAPLLVHPMFYVLGALDGELMMGQALVVLAVYLLLGFVSLIIDRRALMVSALGYVVYVLTLLLKQQGMVSVAFATVALLIGAALLLLSALWQPGRRWAVGFLPQRWRAQVPPVH